MRRRQRAERFKAMQRRRRLNSELGRHGRRAPATPAAPSPPRGDPPTGSDDGDDAAPPHGPPTDQEVAAVLRLDRPWETCVLEGQLLSKDALAGAERLSATTSELLAAYRAVRAYYLDSLAANDLNAINASGIARRAIEGELRKRHTGRFPLMRLTLHLDEALQRHVAGEDGEAA